MTTYAQASAKLGPIKAETKSISREVFDAATAAGHDVWFLWGNGPGDEHGSGLALDFMVRTSAGGQFVRDYIWRHRERLRLRHVIWNQRITSTAVQPGRVRLMADRGNATQNHEDHVHVWFYPGTYRAPAAAPTKPASSTSKPDPTMQRGSTGERVRKLQQGLRAVFPAYAGRLAVDGSFGPATEKAVKEFQKRSRIGVDGKVGPITRRTLLRYGINVT